MYSSDLDPRINLPAQYSSGEAAAWQHTGVYDPGYGEHSPVAVSTFFENLARRLIQDNLDFVTTTTTESGKNVETLNLIDAHPHVGYRLNYHHVYEVFDPQGQSTQLGVIVANPRIKAPGLDGIYNPEVTQRHYFTKREGSIKRVDIAASRRIFSPSIEGAIEHASKIEDPSEDLIIREFKVDALFLKSSIPVKPVSNLTALAARL